MAELKMISEKPKSLKLIKISEGFHDTIKKESQMLKEVKRNKKKWLN